jgi:monoamine oxidase
MTNNSALLVDDGTRLVPAPVDGAVGKVVVVGAGIAGLTAARALRLSGVDVTVVEGRDRIGGRTHTVELGGTPVDLGASWIHPGESSPIQPLYDQIGVERLPAALAGIVASASVLDRSTGSFPDMDTRMEILTAYMSAAAGAEALVAEADVSLSVEAAIAKLSGLEDGATFELLNGLLGMFDGYPTSRTSFAAYAATPPGGEAVALDALPKGGYRRLVDALAHDLNIRLSTAVTEIVDHGQGVRVRTDAGELDASHAIVTVPLGVLKAGSIRFEPPFDPPRRAAIEAIGFGAFEKVALLYDTPMWQVDGEPTHVVVADATKRAWPLVLDMSAWYGAPVIVALTSGEHARHVATMPEGDRVGEVTAIVSQIAGPDCPEPVASVCSCWTADPFTLGCYSGMGGLPPHDVPDDAPDTLAEPHGRVLFAGEATSSTAHSTVDGAWLSGVREAKRLLQRESVPIN